MVKIIDKHTLMQSINRGLGVLYNSKFPVDESKVESIRSNVPSQKIENLKSRKDKLKRQSKKYWDLWVGMLLFNVVITPVIFTYISLMSNFIVALGFGVVMAMINYLIYKYQKIVKNNYYNIDIEDDDWKTYYTENENKEILTVCLYLENNIDVNVKNSMKANLNSLEFEDILKYTITDFKAISNNYKQLTLYHMYLVFKGLIELSLKKETSDLSKVFLAKYNTLFNLIYATIKNLNDEETLVEKLEKSDEFFNKFTQSFYENLIPDIVQIIEVQGLDKYLEEKQVLDMFDMEFQAMSEANAIYEEQREVLKEFRK